MQVRPGVHTELSSQPPPEGTGAAQSCVDESQTNPGPQPLLAHEAPTTGAGAQTPQLVVFSTRQNALAHWPETEHGLDAARGPLGGWHGDGVLPSSKSGQDVPESA